MTAASIESQQSNGDSAEHGDRPDLRQLLHLEAVPDSGSGAVRPTRRVGVRIVLVAAGAMAIDGLTKLTAYRLAQVWAVGPITDVRNPGLSMSVVPNRFPFEAGLALAVLLLFGAWVAGMALRGSLPPWMPGLLIGGAAANLADRLLFGAVHDWLRVGPVVLNLADLMVFAAATGIWISGVAAVLRPSR